MFKMCGRIIIFYHFYRFLSYFFLISQSTFFLLLFKLMLNIDVFIYMQLCIKAKEEMLVYRHFFDHMLYITNIKRELFSVL